MAYGGLRKSFRPVSSVPSPSTSRNRPRSIDVIVLAVDAQDPGLPAVRDCSEIKRHKVSTATMSTCEPSSGCLPLPNNAQSTHKLAGCASPYEAGRPWDPYPGTRQDDPPAACTLGV